MSWHEDDSSVSNGWDPRLGLRELYGAVRILDDWRARGVGERSIQATFLSELHGYRGHALSMLMGWSPSMTAGFLTGPRIVDPSGCVALRKIGEGCATARRTVLESALAFRPGVLRGPQPSYFYVAIGVTWVKFGRSGFASSLDQRLKAARISIREIDLVNRLPVVTLRAVCGGELSAAQMERGLRDRYRARWRELHQEVVCASVLPDLIGTMHGCITEGVQMSSVRGLYPSR